MKRSMSTTVPWEINDASSGPKERSPIDGGEASTIIETTTTVIDLILIIFSSPFSFDELRPSANFRLTFRSCDLALSTSLRPAFSYQCQTTKAKNQKRRWFGNAQSAQTQQW